MRRKVRSKRVCIGMSPFYESYLKAKRGQTETTRREHATGITPSLASAKDPHAGEERGNAGTDPRDGVGGVFPRGPCQDLR